MDNLCNGPNGHASLWLREIQDLRYQPNRVGELNPRSRVVLNREHEKGALGDRERAGAGRVSALVASAAEAGFAEVLDTIQSSLDHVREELKNILLLP
jgi:hypothetical protein